GLASRFIFLEIVEPATTALVVNAAGPRTFRWIDLDLVAVHDACSDPDLLPIYLNGFILIKAVTANLHTRIQFRMDLEFQFQNEMGVVLLGKEERVVRIGNGGTDNLVIFGAIFGLAAALDPAVEVLAVEKVDPGALRFIGE